MPTIHHDHHQRELLEQLFWALSGAVVIASILVAATAGMEPGDAPVATAMLLALAVLWLAHSWRMLWRDERRGR